VSDPGGLLPSASDDSSQPATDPPRRASGFDGELHRKWLARGEYNTLSSPRAIDLDGDGVRDLVTGHGAEVDATDGPSKDLDSYGSVTAHNGATGNLLWEFKAREEIVGSAAFLAIDADEVPDIVIGGRQAELVALSGRDGSLLWRFFDGSVDEARARGYYNFYTPLVIADRDGDGVADLVAANGGDPTRADGEARPPGHLFVLSGATGAVLAGIEMPDAQETYASPVLLDRPEPQIVFGSGGETLPGSLFRIPLSALLDSDASRAKRLASGTLSGFVAPATLADLTRDGVDDIVAVSFGAELKVIDGATDRLLFERKLAGVESFVVPVIAQVTDDGVPDIWLSFDAGHYPTYHANRHVLFDGATGEILFDQLLGTLGPCGHVAADLDGDGRDELIVGTNRALEDVSNLTFTLNGALQFELYWFDPLRREPVRFAEEFLRPAMAAPLLEDLDGDGDLELVIVTSDLGKALATYRLERFELNARAPATPFYGAYLGRNFDGRWDPR
jgi:hypothetical protein